MRTRALLALVLLAGCATPAERGLPDSIAVLGDSISRATNARGESFGEHPASAWATGGDPGDGVDSHYERLRALDPELDIVPFNNARGGARAADLARQAQEAVRQGAQHVVVLIGGNDVCASPPTSPGEFDARLRAMAGVLEPLDATVYLVSVPDVPQLARLFRDNATARAVWDAFDVCPRVLGPGADLDAVGKELQAYNAALAQLADERGWHWDRGAVHETAYEAGDVSELDFFHPSLAGQARLAEVTWRAGPYAKGGP